MDEKRIRVQHRRSAELAAAVEASGETPIEFMLRVMRNKRIPIAIRLDAARSAAPYVHARLSSVEIGNKDKKPFVVQLLSADVDL